jgi:hypothetical protein
MTAKSYAGQCRVMVLTWKDGSTHKADWKFRAPETRDDDGEGGDNDGGDD